MSKVKMYLVITFVLLVCSHALAYAGGWQRIEIDANVSKARAIAIDRDNTDIIYLGSEAGLYKSIDKAKTWKLLAPGLISKVNYIYLDKQDSKIVYTGCQDGLFRSQDAGNSWQKIFHGKDAFEQNVLSIAASSGPFKSVYLATAGGLFFSPLDSLSWQKAGGKLMDAGIISLSESPLDSDILYIVSNKGLFKAKERLSSYERLYSAFNPGSGDTTTDIDSSEEEITPQDYFLSHLAFDAFNSNKLYLGSKEGLLFSQDNGKSWNKLLFSGLFNEEINYVFASSKENRLYLATQYGVFDCKEDACHQLYQGMDFNQCNQLVMDDADNLYLASDKGLYVISSIERKSLALKIDNAHQKLSLPEPPIQEIQKEAIKYAEVYPEKIANWRKQARIKAFFPEVDLTYDKTVFTSTSFPQGRGFVGPTDWGLTLRWDVGDLIFSTEQTSIDVRSRLMVQLRDDILNEVTRLYFERKRLQLELSENTLETKTRKEKELRLEELTALIDGLTNGCLSRSNKTGSSAK